MNSGKISPKYISSEMSSDDEVNNAIQSINQSINDLNSSNIQDKNNRDIENRKRANHTGSQLSSTISDFASSVRQTVITGLSITVNAVIQATDSLLTALGKLQAQISKRPTMYNSALIDNPKIWVGETTVSNGSWSVNYASAGFTEIFGVFAQAPSTGNDNGNANYASVNHSTVTLTTASGRSSNAVTVGLLLATVNQASSNGTLIKVIVFGR